MQLLLLPANTKLPPREQRAARHTGCRASPGRDMAVKHPLPGQVPQKHAGLLSAPRMEKSHLCLQNNICPAVPSIPNEPSSPMLSLRSALRHEQLDRSLSEAVSQPSTSHLPWTGTFAWGPQRAFGAAESQRQSWQRGVPVH